MLPRNMSYFLLPQRVPKNYSVKQKLCYLVCACILFCYWLFFYTTREQSEFFENPHIHGKALPKKFMARNEFVISQKGCRIPKMTVSCATVLNFIENEPSIRCEYRSVSSNKTQNAKDGNVWLPPLVIDTSENRLAVNMSSLIFYGKTTADCSYMSFNRPSKSNGSKSIDNAVEFSGTNEFVDTKTGARIDSEFVKVQCKDENDERPFYTDFFAFVQPKEEVENRCSNYDQQTRSSNSDKLNVMILGLDALSRLNFYRQMPKSAEYLEKDLGAIVMKGFNKVGDNTFPNLIPTLTGLSIEQLQKVCWPSQDDFFDNCSFIWDEFQNKGFRTVFAEDTPFIGAFNYVKNGFEGRPTDYYLRPFYVQAEQEIGHQKPGNCYLCIGSRLSLSVVLDYAFRHALIWKNKKFFGFFWSTSFTHDSFNLPSQGDEVLLTFLQKFNDNNLTESTALIMMSDHGLRWGSFRETFQGHLEERLPTLMFVLPAWFKSKYRRATENLRYNQKMLTSHFDLYHTLVDLTNLTRLEDGVQVHKTASTHAKAKSLFRRISTRRNCKSAGIPRNYCTCHDKVKSLPVNDTRVNISANVLIMHLNTLLENHSECAQLQLHSIESATLESSTMGGEGVKLAGRVSDIVLSIRVAPGHGLFEGIVSYNPEEKTYYVVGQVSRINTYDAQSFCVDDNILKLYCFCKL